MKQTIWGLSVACSLFALLILGCLGLAQKTQAPAVVRQPQTLGAPHSPALQTTGGLVLNAKLGVNPNGCGDQPTINVRIGTVVYYCYEARNATTQTLRVHTLDSALAGDQWRNIVVDLPPNGIINPRFNGVVISRVVVSSLVEAATWTARNDNLVVSATATTTINAIGPLNVRLTLGRSPPCATTTNLLAPLNGRLYYCLIIDNTTAVTLTNHTISIPANGFQTNLTYVVPPSSRLVLTDGLLPFLGINLSLGQTITRAQTSTATVTSQTNDNRLFSGAAGVRWEIGQTGIDLIKTISLQNSAACPPATNVINVARDTPIYYCLRVRNTGAVTLTDHSFVEPNAALGGSPINGQFTYPLAPGATMTLTRASITATPGLVYTNLPVLGPFSQPITATYRLTFTSASADNFQATDTATSTFRLAGPVYQLEYNANSTDNLCGVTSINLQVGDRIWYCLRVRNIGPIELTNHSFQLFVSPPRRQGERYSYTAAGKFTHPLPPNGVMTLTNAFLTTKGVAAVMGPYTLTAPLTNTSKVTGTIILTSTNPNLGQILVARATNNQIGLVNFATSTPTFTSTPPTPETFTPIPGTTPTPTPTLSPTPITPTPTAITLSLLPTPIPTPDLRVRDVTAPAAGQLPQDQSPVAQPTSLLPTPPLDPMFVAATQTTDAILTATAFATLQPPTPTFTETPLPTDTPTETPTATPTPTATATQRPIDAPTATAVTNYGAALPSALQSMFAVASWIWFMVGVLAFFITAGIVVGMGLRQRERQRFQLDQPAPPPATGQPAPPPDPSPSRFTEEDDNWPPSLP